ncbi:MAG: hypothetical protein AB7E77_08360, partial [Desulfobulbus sp.]
RKRPITFHGSPLCFHEAFVGRPDANSWCFRMRNIAISLIVKLFSFPNLLLLLVPGLKPGHIVFLQKDRFAKYVKIHAL